MVFSECFSVNEYELNLLESGAFIFYGTEQFLDYLPPHKLASMNLPSESLKLFPEPDSRFFVDVIQQGIWSWLCRPS